MRNNVGFIWDIDGLVVDSPHEDAWRSTVLGEPWKAEELNSDFYFVHVASRPRYEGGNNILQLKGVYERFGATSKEQKTELLEKFCTQKNLLIRKLIREGKFTLFADAVTLLLKAKSMGVLQAAASASKNAEDMLSRVSRTRITKEGGDDLGALKEKDTLHSIFDIHACGLDVGGKREILRTAAERLNSISKKSIEKFVVFEDAASGIEAAKSLGYYAVGVWRIGEEDALRRAGADIITRDLRKIVIEDLL